MTAKAKLFLIPNALSGDNFKEVIPTSVAEEIKDVRTFLVEHPKNARQLLAGIGLRDIIDSSEFLSIHEGFTNEIRQVVSKVFKNGGQVGVISDAGCPGVADPGNEAVKLAHQIGVKVIPLTGPSSIILALMASGFNGQNFVFHGYLPKDQSERKKKIKELEKDMRQNDQTQIFIETPFRNEHLLGDLLSECQKNTVICLAVNLTLPDEFIGVKAVEEWRGIKPEIHKKQCIFLMYR